MSREIKFRIWNLNRNKFIKTDYLAIQADGKFVERHIWYDEGDDYYWDESWNEVGAEGYIAQQFTGLLDKNGKEIYEGDVVQFPQGQCPNTGAICYGTFTSSHEGGYSRGHEHIGFFITDAHNNQLFSSDGEDIEWKDVLVVGNIFENPGLLP